MPTLWVKDNKEKPVLITKGDCRSFGQRVRGKGKPRYCIKLKQERGWARHLIVVDREERPGEVELKLKGRRKLRERSANSDSGTDHRANSGTK
jgi:hypothetical protein